MSNQHSETEAWLDGKPPVYQVYDDGYSVRAMTPDDVKIVQNWWSGFEIVCPDDLEITVSMCTPGRGCYIGEYKGEVVATALRVHWGHGVYYGSIYYVKEQHRSKGFGTRLRDQVARGHIGDNLLAIDGLAGDVAKKNTERFGYKAAFVSRRMVGKAKSSYGVKCSRKLVTADDVTFQEMIDFDNKHFVCKDSPQRRQFLERWLKIKGGATCVALSDNGSIVGYGCRRPALESQPGNHKVGPIYAESTEVAKVILQKLCQEVEGQDVSVNVWTPNVASIQMFEEFGFSQVFDCLRMHINGTPEYKDTVYCYTSMDTCGF